VAVCTRDRENFSVRWFHTGTGRILLHEVEFQTSIRTLNLLWRLMAPFGVFTHCIVHCNARVALGSRSMITYFCPLLPLTFLRAVSAFSSPPVGWASSCR
jgi:hypothetical protein